MNYDFSADQILYEDNHLFVINKRPGQIVQSDNTGDVCLRELIQAFRKERDHKPGNAYCGVVHRIDRPVSGVVLFTKTDKALSRINAMIQRRELQKTYWAVTHTAPPQPQGTLTDWLWRNEKQNKSYVVDKERPGAKLAKLSYRVLSQSEGGYYLLEVDLHTGRHHQIRTQLAHMGCPIKGDLKYGYPRSNPDCSISLHAHRLVLEHPVRHTLLDIQAPPPAGAPWDIFPDISIPS